MRSFVYIVHLMPFAVTGLTVWTSSSSSRIVPSFVHTIHHSPFAVHELTVWTSSSSSRVVPSFVYTIHHTPFAVHGPTVWTSSSSSRVHHMFLPSSSRRTVSLSDTSLVFTRVQYTTRTTNEAHNIYLIRGRSPQSPKRCNLSRVVTRFLRQTNVLHVALPPVLTIFTLCLWGDNKFLAYYKSRRANRTRVFFFRTILIHKNMRIRHMCSDPCSLF